MSGITPYHYYFCAKNKCPKKNLVWEETQNQNPSKLEKAPDLLQKICEYVPSNALNTASKINKKWEKEAISVKTKLLQEYVEKNAFGAMKWELYFGSVEKHPLNLKMWDILHENDPIEPKKLVKDTSILFFFPKKVNNQPLTLNSFQKMIQNQRKNSGGYEVQYGYTNKHVMERVGDAANPTSCWILMRKDVIPISRGEPFNVQSNMSGLVPTTLEATVGILTHYINAGEKTFTNTPRITFTRCEEVTKKGRHIVVGGFDAHGLTIDDTDRDSEIFGITELQKFPCGKEW